jgi:hypothetical protein
MNNRADYNHLPEAVREEARIEARTRAMAAAQRYADLLVAEAGIAARAVMPDVAELTFRLTTGEVGLSASLIAADAADGRRLWHVDNGEWPDESLVTDYLAAAETWFSGYFTATGDSGELVVLDLDGD